MRWLHVSDSAGVARLLDGGELLLSTGSSWPADPGGSAPLRRRAGGCRALGSRSRARHALPLRAPRWSSRQPERGLALDRPASRGEVRDAHRGRAQPDHRGSDRRAARSRRGARAVHGARAARLARRLHRPSAGSDARRARHPREPRARGRGGRGSARARGGAVHRVGAALSSAHRRARAAARARRRCRLPTSGSSCRSRRAASAGASLIALPGPDHAAGRTAVLEQGAIALAVGRLADGESDEWGRIGRRRLLDGLLAGRFAGVGGAAARLEAAGLPLRGARLFGIVVSGAPVSAEAAAAAARALRGRALIGSAPDGVAAPASATLLSIPADATFDDTAALAFARALVEAGQRRRSRGRLGRAECGGARCGARVAARGRRPRARPSSPRRGRAASASRREPAARAARDRAARRPPGARARRADAGAPDRARPRPAVATCWTCSRRCSRIRAIGLPRHPLRICRARCSTSGSRCSKSCSTSISTTARRRPRCISRCWCGAARGADGRGGRGLLASGSGATVES